MATAQGGHSCMSWQLDEGQWCAESWGTTSVRTFCVVVVVRAGCVPKRCWKELLLQPHLIC